MNKNEKELFRKMLEINTYVLNNIDENNIYKFLNIYLKFENEIKNVILIKKSVGNKKPIWTKFSQMSEDEIVIEFNNIEKYPDLDSIKKAVKGYLPLSKVSRVKTRDTLIKHILDIYKRGEIISKIGKEDLTDESNKRV